MKFPNYLISSLAFVGAFSLIIMACSADNSNNANTVNSVGKYQITGITTGGGWHVIDTETGVVKTYKLNPNSGGAIVYELVNTTATQ
jgi:hypothetical protein